VAHVGVSRLLNSFGSAVSDTSIMIMSDQSAAWEEYSTRRSREPQGQEGGQEPSGKKEYDYKGHKVLIQALKIPAPVTTIHVNLWIDENAIEPMKTSDWPT
jgi:hypothetical protein